MYVSNELNSTVAVYRYDEATGTAAPLQALSTLPEGYSEQNDVAHLMLDPSGRFLYVSNRGHDSLAVYRVDAASGRLALVEIVPTQGHTPRNFSFDPSGAYLLVGNQNSDTLIIFRADAAAGKLTPTGTVDLHPRPGLHPLLTQ